jgi:hypothetical protein
LLARYHDEAFICSTRSGYLEKAEPFPKKLAYELLANINGNQ